jgi:hypothetical protein
MTVKKKLLLAITGFIVMMTAFALVPAVVSAATDPFQGVCQSGGGGGSPVCGTGGGADPLAGQNGAIVRITTILAIVAGIVSVIFLVWGGIKYITSGGDSSGVSSAKNTIIAALIGLVIAALARPIINFVIGRL